MIYFVTGKDYTGMHRRMDVGQSLGILSSMQNIGVDTETTGLDPHRDKILTLQLGNKDTQFVIDCTTVDINLYRPVLENKNKLLLFWNAKFDLQFLFRYHIVPHKVWDGFVVESLMHLGLSHDEFSASLKSACHTYLGLDMDKTIRGQIFRRGMDDEVISYAAGDVEHLERIMELQKVKLKQLGLTKAVDYENRFVLPLSYMEWCGIHLDVDKWKAKMAKDEQRKDDALLKCNMWIIDHFKIGEYIEYKAKPFKLDWNQARLLPKSEYTVVQTPYSNKRDYYSTKRFEMKRVYLVASDYTNDLFDTNPGKKAATLNWESVPQVQALFEHLGVDVSNGIEANLLKKQEQVCSLIPLYITYKEAAKVTSTYGKNFLVQIHPDTGRVHTKFYQFGTKTGRISSGSKDDRSGKGSADKKVNLLNLPRDEETRACFTAEEGNRFISIDYSGQESFIMADTTGDKAMLEELNHGEGDMHTLSAKMLYDQIPKNMPAADVKKQFHDERQRAKSLEFAVFYGSQGKAIATNLNLSDDEATELYNKFVDGFSGLKKWQDMRRKDWLDKGYILINAKTGHKSFVSHFDAFTRDRKEFSGNDFWNKYKALKEVDSEDPLVLRVKKYFKRRSSTERDSINYPVQGTGALCMKTAMCNFFEWLRRKGLLFKVKLCVMPYDEVCFEAPDAVADECALKMRDCMVKSGAYFVTKCKLDAEVSYDDNGKLPNYWIH